MNCLHCGKKQEEGHRCTRIRMYGGVWDPASLYNEFRIQRSYKYPPKGMEHFAQFKIEDKVNNGKV